MSKYKPGETSKNVLDKKNEITKSLLIKSKLLDQILSREDIPDSLKIKGNSVSQAAVHKWHDDKLGVTAYSRNSAHAKHNSHALKALLKSINNINKRIKSNKATGINAHSYTLSNSANSYENTLRKENEMLRVALSEVYRAYMQLLDYHREDRKIDEAYQKLILSQANILGRHRVREVK
ncbi:hypothetical protein [Ketobacter sp.]|uniref:hypothetical protein n=1 Tax=Ketobacter sp. TaxID=2083498 RepID=UPI000F15B0D2|nr:hypothetical protein [Ketobacter sp.]RLU01652.1 MAG: hypothetical protein D9N14_02485 [Ketobacter sp.]